MTEQEIYSGLQRVFDGVFRGRDIKLTPTLSAEDVPGWDSFMQVNLIVGTEELFEIDLADEDIDELANVGDLVRVIARLKA